MLQLQQNPHRLSPSLSDGSFDSSETSGPAALTLTKLKHTSTGSKVNAYCAVVLPIPDHRHRQPQSGRMGRSDPSIDKSHEVRQMYSICVFVANLMPVRTATFLTSAPHTPHPHRQVRRHQACYRGDLAVSHSGTRCDMICASACISLLTRYPSLPNTMYQRRCCDFALHRAWAWTVALSITFGSEAVPRDGWARSERPCRTSGFVLGGISEGGGGCVGPRRLCSSVCQWVCSV